MIEALPGPSGIKKPVSAIAVHDALIELINQNVYGHVVARAGTAQDGCEANRE